MNNLMIDIETLGTRPYSAILSIAAIPFDLKTGKVGDDFVKVIELEDSLKSGLRVDADTIKWWMNQSDTAKKVSFNSGVSLKEAVNEFESFCLNNFDESSLCPWGNSASFDLGILKDSFERVNKKVPWKFYNERCARTFMSISKKIKCSIEFEGEAHDPYYDCLHQIKVCHAIYKAISRKVEE